MSKFPDIGPDVAEAPIPLVKSWWHEICTLVGLWGLREKGTVRQLKKGEAVYRRNGPVLCLKWCEKKRSVTVMSTVHPAVYVEIKKRH